VASDNLLDVWEQALDSQRAIRGGDWVEPQFERSEDLEFQGNFMEFQFLRLFKLGVCQVLGAPRSWRTPDRKTEIGRRKLLVLSGQVAGW